MNVLLCGIQMSSLLPTATLKKLGHNFAVYPALVIILKWICYLPYACPYSLFNTKFS